MKDSAAGSPRFLRIGLLLLIVLGIEWRIAEPARIANDPDLAPMPWALLALLLPVGLGVWVYEVTSSGRPDFKNDLLWAVLAGTMCYVGLSLAIRYL